MEKFVFLLVLQKVPSLRFVITEKAPTTAFTFKTLLRHYAKPMLDTDSKVI